MRLEVISISNKLTKWEDETLNFYLKQISSFVNITIQNIKPAQGKNLNIREVQNNEEKNIFIVNEKHKVPVPEKFFEIIKFVFEKKIVSYKSIKSQFNSISDETITEFIDAMKNMNVFI